MKQNYTFPSIYNLAWLAIASQITVMAVSIIDLLFIGRMANATFLIGAAAIANNVCAALYAFLEGIRTGTTVMVARFFGAQKSCEIGRTITLSFFFMLAIGIGTALLPFTPFASRLLFKMLNGQAMASAGTPYLTIRLLGLPFHLFIFAVIGLFRGLKNATIPFLIAGAVCGFNVVFNYIFMHGIFGAPQIGMKGIAVATVISYVLGAIVSLFFVILSPLTRGYLTIKKTCEPILKTFVKIGGEIGLYAGSLILALFFFIAIYSNQGEVTFAAHQIAFQVFLITYVPITGFFVAASILIGKLLGEKKQNIVTNVTKKIFYASLPFVGVMSLGFALFAKQIAQFFSPNNAQVVELAVPSIYLVCLTQFFSASYLVLKGALTATKDTRFVFIAGTASSYLIFLPLTYWLGIIKGYGIFGGYFALLIWTALDTVVFGWRLLFAQPWRWINGTESGGLNSPAK